MSYQALFVASIPFLTQKSTGGIAIMKRNYEILCELCGKENVTVCIVNKTKPEDMPEDGSCVWLHGNEKGILRTIQEFLGHNYISAKGEKQLESLLKQKQFNLVWLDNPQYGRLAGQIKKKYSAKIVSFAHNVESEYIKIFCKASALKPHFYKKIKQIERNERMALENSDVFACISARDREMYEKKYGREIRTLLPVTLADQYKGAALEGRPEGNAAGYFLFVGSYFKPNTDGVCWLIRNVFSKCSAELRIAGRGMEKLLEDLQENLPENVAILGGVDDLSELYEGAAAVIMPIFSGSGMKVKTAEAMMYGKAVIASDEALEGYAVEGLSGIERCNTEEEFLEAIQKYNLCNETFYPEIRKYYLENCCTENVVAGFREKLLHILQD